MRNPPRARWLSYRAPAAAVSAAVLVLLGGAVAAPQAGAAVPEVGVGEHGCGTGWSRSSAGRLQVRLDNTARDPADVYLIAPGNGDVYAEVLSLLPGVPRTLATTLTGGEYAFRCVFTDGTVATSRTYTVSGTADDAVSGVPPLPDLDLAAPVAAYRSYVSRSLPGLLADTRGLDADIRSGDLVRARTDWLTAHLDYERLGAAYNSFGDFDGEIDGTADGLPGGTADPSWSGFHRIEYGLWHGQKEAVLRPLADALTASVQRMVADFPSADTDPGDLPLRSHEILENALEFQLTGASDYGSGTTLATLQANVQGTEEVLATLTPLITPRDPGLLPAVDAGLDELDADLAGCRSASGVWTPPSALARPRRQQLDSVLGDLLEQLSTVPDLLQGRTSA